MYGKENFDTQVLRLRTEYLPRQSFQRKMNFINSIGMSTELLKATMNRLNHLIIWKREAY